MGDLLMPSGGIGGGASAETFACSHEVDSLDFFLSHSWRDSGRLKWILLLWEMNFTSALLLSSLGGAVVLATILAQPSLTGMSFAFIAFTLRLSVALMFLFVLLSAHRINGTNPVFFLDKACINQTDPVLKELGIKNIGGFLRHSNCMLVTCGKDYFSRLWCCYELSLYILLRGPRAVRLVPLYQAGFGVLLVLIVVVLDLVSAAVSFAICHLLHLPSSLGKLDPAVHLNIRVCLWYSCFGILVSWYKIDLHANGQSLKADLATFEVRNAHAWCCEVSHVLPDGEQIPCDRVFVEANIKAWYGTEEHDGLDEFNDQVRTNVSADVASLIGKTPLLPLHIIVMLTALTSWGGICRIFVYLFHTECLELKETMSRNGDEITMLLLVERRIFYAAQFCLMNFAYQLFLDAVGGLVLVWLHDRNVPWFRSLSALFGGVAYGILGCVFCTLVGFGHLPPQFAHLEPPPLIRACMYIGLVLLAVLMRSLAK
jgi:hypothetical protein